MNRKIFGFLPLELRTAEGNDRGGLLLEGKAIVYNTPTVIFSFEGQEYKEVIDRRALDTTDLSDVVLRYNHSDQFAILARTRNGSLQLTKRSDGLYMNAILQDDIQVHRDLYAAVKSGLVDKMSFGFVVADDGDEYDEFSRTRRIKDIRRIYDLSICDFPAYESTYVEARSRLEGYANTDKERHERDLLQTRLKLLKARIF